jgi:hypothetical protein
MDPSTEEPGEVFTTTALGQRVTVKLTPQSGVSGKQRVNFAVPLQPGQLRDATLVRLLAAGREVSTATRLLARYADGSARSVQIQADLTFSGPMDVEVVLGSARTAPALSLVPVSQTLKAAGGESGPLVWAQLPAAWLSGSGVAGPQVTEAEVAGGPLDAWRRVCDYARHNVESFLNLKGDAAVWLFDRGTAMYRGYARRGDLGTLQSAYRETAIYRNGITGTGTSTRIGVPGKADDLKYHYTQNMALHYLLTGDDRFRESAEAVATRAAALWPRPGYTSSTNFWTERHAGFALLAYVWAMIVSDDRAAEFRTLADQAVTAYINGQATYPSNYTDREARCFAHSGASQGEDYSSAGCSPWMSAILADGMDAYATERGGTQATAARASLVQLGRMLAKEGRDGSGRPFYWLGVGSGRDEVDSYDEHWGESAYVVAMAYHHTGRSDTRLRTVASELMAGLKAKGVAPHMRSFNWQCRSAPGAAYFLK